MKILFVSNNFPPEVNAPATRLIEHGRVWVQDGHELEVLTSNPHFPEGKVYQGYRNRWKQEQVDGIDVTRVPMYVTANEGTVKRTFSYVSYMLSANWYLRTVKRRKPDLVVATSPQFFAALGGHFIARRLGVPFIFEVRDLWPESIVAVGAVKRNAIIRFFERIEQFLYRKADHIVVVTESFERFIVNRGIDARKISVIKNGADLQSWTAPLDSTRVAEMRKRFGLEGKFVAAYVGTIGMAHRADILLEAARRCTDPEIMFVVVGAGAARAELELRAKEANLPNFKLLDKVTKDEVRYLMALTDASVVHLKASPLFETVIPSKIFEAMATRTPIVMGVKGEARGIVEAAGAGRCIEPENVDQLLDAVLELKNCPEKCRSIGDSGHRYVMEHFNRAVLARRYETLFQKVVADRKR